MRERVRTLAPVVDTSPHASQRNGHPALFIFIVGAAFLALFLVGVMTQIQTNEAFIQNAGQVDVYKPDWAILLQIPNLVLGNLSPGESVATIFGWGIELMYLGFIIGHELLQHSVMRSGILMANIFRTGAWIIILFNGWTDFTYGTLGGGFWGHAGFAAVTSFIVGFFGTIGMYLIGEAWRRL